MKKFLLFLFALQSLSGCYQTQINPHYNSDLTWARFESSPVYLSFKNTKDTPFYFFLSRDSDSNDYKIRVRWRSPTKGDILFNGYSTTLKFFINREKILTFTPIKRPQIVAYDINSYGHEEEGVFLLTRDEFFAIAYAKDVQVELNGRNNTVLAYFNRRNTLKSFQKFAEDSR